MQFFHFLLCVAIVVWVHAGYMFIRLINKSPHYQAILESENISEDDIGYMCCYIGFYGHFNNQDKGKHASRNYLTFYALGENTNYCNSKTTPPEVPRNKFDRIIEYYHGTTHRCNKIELVDQIMYFMNTMVRPRTEVRITKLRSLRKTEFLSKQNESVNDDEAAKINNDIDVLLHNSGIVNVDKKIESSYEENIEPLGDILSFGRISDIDFMFKPDLLKFSLNPEVPSKKSVRSSG